MSKKPDNQPETAAAPDLRPCVFESLADLMQRRGGDLGDKLRPYVLNVPGGGKCYVVANSPGQAAMTVCMPTLVTQKEQLAAALAAMKGKE